MRAAKDYTDWVYGEYEKTLRLDKVEGSKRFHRFLQYETPRFSSARRIGQLLNLRHEYPILREGVHTIRFTAERGKKAVVYAVAYWWEETGIEYISTMPTYVSCDGEYRNRLIRTSALYEAFEKYHAATDPAEEAVLSDLSTGKLDLHVRILPSGERSQEIATLVDEKRLAILAYVASWMTSWIDNQNGRFPSHTRPEYLPVVLKANKSVMRAIDQNTRDDLSLFTSVVIRGRPVGDLRIEVGMKSTPLKSWGTVRLGDIRFRAWREIFINRFVRDLVVNFAAPGFSVAGDWCYFDGSGLTAYENKAMGKLYARSGEARKTLERLREARFPARSAKAPALDERIYTAVKFARESVVYSDVSLVVSYEHCGPTFANLPRRDRRLQYPRTDEIATFTNPGLFAKTIFEVLYSCAILHARVGVVHGDLHLNNYTLRRAAELDLPVSPLKPQLGRTRRMQHPITAFVVQDERTTYVFPYDGQQACLVDFSRSIIGGEFGLEHVRREFGAQFVQNYIVDQAPEAAETVERHAPTFTARNRAAVHQLALDEPAIFFELLRAVDFIAVGGGLADMIEIELARDKKAKAAGEKPKHLRWFTADPRSLEIARGVERRARNWLLSSLAAALAGDVRRPEDLGGGTDEVLGGPTSAYAAVLREFTPWTFGAWKPADLQAGFLADIHNATVPLTYSLAEPGLLPPTMQIPEIKKHRGKRTLLEIINRPPELATRAEASGRDAAEHLAALEPADLDTADFFAGLPE